MLLPPVFLLLCLFNFLDFVTFRLSLFVVVSKPRLWVLSTFNPDSKRSEAEIQIGVWTSTVLCCLPMLQYSPHPLREERLLLFKVDFLNQTACWCYPWFCLFSTSPLPDKIGTNKTVYEPDCGLGVSLNPFHFIELMTWTTSYKSNSKILILSSYLEWK